LSEEKVSFASQGLRLSGVVRVPAAAARGERRPAGIVLHGFGSNKDANNVLEPCKFLERLGYVTLRFDMRGCGESEGERGRVICLEQVQNTRDAPAFLAEQPAVQPERIALIGSSFGAAVAIYAGGVEPRAAAVISSGGWGHGERKFRGQHPTAQGWARFTAMLEEGRRHWARTALSSHGCQNPDASSTLRGAAMPPKRSSTPFSRFCARAFWPLEISDSTA